MLSGLLLVLVSVVSPSVAGVSAAAATIRVLGEEGWVGGGGVDRAYAERGPADGVGSPIYVASGSSTVWQTKVGGGEYNMVGLEGGGQSAVGGRRALGGAMKETRRGLTAE